MAVILNIETSTNVCSIALSKDFKILSLKESKEEKSHASLLNVFIEEIFKANNLTASGLDAVAVGKGPGSFTGLRIGVSVSKGICYGSNTPLIGINTLHTMAYGMANNSIIKSLNLENIRDTWLCPMLDAKRMEVYSAFFDFNNHFKTPVSAEIINSNSFQNILTERQVVFFGNGSHKCKNVITHPNAFFIDNIHPSAQNMISLAEIAFKNKEFENVAYFQPFYLKDFVTTTPKKNIFT